MLLQKCTNMYWSKTCSHVCPAIKSVLTFPSVVVLSLSRSFSLSPAFLELGPGTVCACSLSDSAACANLSGAMVCLLVHGRR